MERRGAVLGRDLTPTRPGRLDHTSRRRLGTSWFAFLSPSRHWWYISHAFQSILVNLSVNSHAVTPPCANQSHNRRRCAVARASETLRRRGTCAPMCCGMVEEKDMHEAGLSCSRKQPVSTTSLESLTQVDLLLPSHPKSSPHRHLLLGSCP